MAGDTHDASSLDRLALGSVGFGLLFGLGWWVLVALAVVGLHRTAT